MESSFITNFKEQLPERHAQINAIDLSNGNIIEINILLYINQIYLILFNIK